MASFQIDPVINTLRKAGVPKIDIESRLGIPPDEGGPIDSRSSVSESDVMKRGHFKNHYRSEQEKDLTELVGLLLDAGARLDLLEDTEDASPLLRGSPTPLGWLKRLMPSAFQKAVAHWQQNLKDSDGNLEAIPSHTRPSQARYERSGTISDGSRLDRLPSEIIGHIVSYLRSSDLYSIRLVGRFLLTSSFSAFKAQICCRRVNLTIKALQTLHEQLMLESHPVWHIKEIYLDLEDGTDDVRPVDCANDSDDSGQSALSQLENLLTQYFVVAGSKGVLQNVVLQKGHNALSLMLSALKRSGLVLHKLCLAPDGGRQHSVAIDGLRDFADIGNLSPSLCKLQHFTWAITTFEEPTWYSLQNIAILNKILGMMPMLRTLYLWRYSNTLNRPVAYFLESCIDAILAMRQLQQLTLRGISASESAMHKLVSQTSAKRIALEYIRLSPGGIFRSILDVLTSGRFDYFELDDIHEVDDNRKWLIHYDCPGYVKFPTTNYRMGPSKIVREGRETQRSIGYRRDGGRMAGSGDTQTYIQHVRRMFGTN